MMSRRACRVGTRPILGLLLLGASSFGNDSCIDGAAGYGGTPRGAIGCQFASGECPEDPYHLGRYERFRTVFRRWSWKKNTSHAELLYRPSPPYWEPGHGYHETQWRRGEAAFTAYSCPIVEPGVIVAPMLEDLHQSPTPDAFPAEPVPEARPPYSPPADQPDLPSPKEMEVKPLPRVGAHIEMRPIAPPAPMPSSVDASVIPALPPASVQEAEVEKTTSSNESLGLFDEVEPAPDPGRATVQPIRSIVERQEAPAFDTVENAEVRPTSTEAFLPPALVGALVDEEFLAPLVVQASGLDNAGWSGVEGDGQWRPHHESPAAVSVETAIATDDQPSTPVKVHQASAQSPAAPTSEASGWKSKGFRPTPASRRGPAPDAPTSRPTAPGVPVPDVSDSTGAAPSFLPPDMVFGEVQLEP